MPATPTAAEQIRSALLRPSTPTLAIDDGSVAHPTLQHLLPDGTLALLVSNTDPILTVGPPPRAAMLEITDQAALSLRQPVRSLTWITGVVETMPDADQRAVAVDIAEHRPHHDLLEVGHSATMLRLRPISAVLADGRGATAASVDELAAARPDPFCLLENTWLTHLEHVHTDLLATLARNLPSHLRRHRVRPLAIDRYGLSLRVETDDGAGGAGVDVRLPFATEATSPPELSRAVRALAGCPFHRGLRARHGALP